MQDRQDGGGGDAQQAGCGGDGRQVWWWGWKTGHGGDGRQVVVVGMRIYSRTYI